METRSRTRLLLRGAAVLAAFGALTAPATAGAAVKAPVITKVTPMSVNVGEKLIIRGKYFRRGKGRNRVLFHRDGGKSLFVKADVSTKVRMTVVIPQRLESYMPQPGGHAAPARFRLRVLTTKLSRSFTAAHNSPLVGPRLPKSVTGPGSGTDTSVSAPEGDCDGDGIPNSVDTDDDNDLLPDSLEAQLGTNPCNGDTDGDGVEDGYEYQSAIDLNNDDYQSPNTVIPYPGKRPYPNPLFKDADVDYDGDGLTMATEYDLWKYTYTVDHTATRTLHPLSYSDGTQYSLSMLQNGDGVRVPTMTAGNYTPPQQFWSWATLNGYANPVLHILGTTTYTAYNLFDFDRDGVVTNAERYYWAGPGATLNSTVSDDERDEDADGLTNFEEANGPMSGAEWWTSCYQSEGAYPVKYAGTSPTDADSDGDGILDGADDQDHDDVPNIMELSRVAASHRPNQSGGQVCTPASGEVPDAAVPAGRVNPFNPCLPDPNSRTCEQHPVIGNSAYAPYTADGPKYFVLN
jgi:hypothetical protein